MIVYDFLVPYVFFTIIILVQYLYWSAIITPGRFMFTGMEVPHPLDFIDEIIDYEIDFRGTSAGQYLWEVSLGLVLTTVMSLIAAGLMAIGWPIVLIIIGAVKLIEKRQESIKNN
jgi:hypothetical protein